IPADVGGAAVVRARGPAPAQARTPERCTGAVRSTPRLGWTGRGSRRGSARREGDRARAATPRVGSGRGLAEPPRPRSQIGLRRKGTRPSRSADRTPVRRVPSLLAAALILFIAQICARAAPAHRQVELIIGAAANEGELLEPSIREMLVAKSLRVVT